MRALPEAVRAYSGGHRWVALGALWEGTSVGHAAERAGSRASQHHRTADQAPTKRANPHRPQQSTSSYWDSAARHARRPCQAPFERNACTRPVSSPPKTPSGPKFQEIVDGSITRSPEADRAWFERVIEFWIAKLVMAGEPLLVDDNNLDAMFET